MVLVDTNILLRSAQRTHSQFEIAKRALATLRREREELLLSAQNLIEFWVVATRPEKYNGLAMSVETAAREIAILKEQFDLLPEAPLVFPEWERLVSTYSVSGKNAHDARLVAIMNVHGIDKILTFDSGDFLRFREIKVLDPRSFV